MDYCACARPSGHCGNILFNLITWLDRFILDHRFCLVLNPRKAAVSLLIRLLFAVFILVINANPALAQQQVQVDRPPETSAILTDLAWILGATHYLSVLCEGRNSQTWRDAMVELLELENPHYRLRRNLVGEFNAGYQNQQRRFYSCDTVSKQQLQTISKQGRILSASLADPYLK